MRVAYLIILILLFSIPAFCQKPDLNFHHISIDKGLNGSFVTKLLQDQKGYIWLATHDGINKYDGNRISAYKNVLGDKYSLSANTISSLYIDDKNNLWVGTRTGLNLYNRKKNNFTRYLVNRPITSIFKDSNKNLWVGTMEGEVFILQNPDNSILKIGNKSKTLDTRITGILETDDGKILFGTESGLRTYDKESNSIVDYDPNIKSISAVILDLDGNLWIATKGYGVFYRKRSNGEYINFTSAPNQDVSLPENYILTIAEDAKGRIWMGTDHSGIVIYDKKKNQMYRYPPVLRDNESLNCPSVYDIKLDNQNNILIGTYGCGASIVTERSIKKFKQIPEDQTSLSHNKVLSFAEDSNGKIWIGTDGGGLNLFDQQENTFKAFKHNPKDSTSISADFVVDIEPDKKGNLWLAFWGGGVDYFDTEKNKFYHHLHKDNDKNSISKNNVWSLLLCNDTLLFIGTFGAGVDIYDIKNSTFRNYSKKNSSLPSNEILDLYQDKQNNIWVGTSNGLSHFDLKKNKLSTYKHVEYSALENSDYRIHTVVEDSKGVLWLGTNQGLSVFDRKKKNFKTFGIKDGLPSEKVHGVIEDDFGNLWLSTMLGVSKFNTTSKSFLNYYPSDGLQGDEFYENAYLKTSTGKILFGGKEGFNSIDPSKIIESNYTPPIYFTDLKIFNRSVSPTDKDSILTTHISETKEIQISYKESFISVEYSALNFLTPDKTLYAYKLEGQDKDWNYVGNSRYATYTNLEPGTYVLKVKATSQYGVWNESPATLKIVVRPPFWKTLWFKIIVFLGSVCAIFTIHQIRLRSILRKKAILEEKVKLRTLEISRKNLEILEQSEELKAQSEELRATVTDLDLQKNQVEALLKEVTDSIKAAKIIQDSILPSPQYIKQYLPNYFIFNKPKDVVGGDFYWFAQIENKIIVATIDCTGHGVSGAFMSITGHHLLNKCILNHKVKSAAQILDQLNYEVIEGLNGNREDEKILDGMDISLCIIDTQNNTLEFAGASNPLYLIRKDQLIELKGNRHSIGLSINKKIIPFTNHLIHIEPNDAFYIFSDGIADQFGGDSGEEKFSYRRLKATFLEIQHHEMKRQSNILEEKYSAWAKNTPQLDDILVIGFRT